MLPSWPTIKKASRMQPAQVFAGDSQRIEVFRADHSGLPHEFQDPL